MGASSKLLTAFTQYYLENDISSIHLVITSIGDVRLSVKMAMPVQFTLCVFNKVNIVTASIVIECICCC